MKRIACLLLSFMVAAFVMAAEPFTAFRVTGTVLLRDAKGLWTPLQVGEGLRPADVLHFSDGAVIYLLDNRTKCIFKIKSQGENKVATLVVKARKKATNTILSLTQQIQDIQEKQSKSDKKNQHGVVHGFVLRGEDIMMMPSTLEYTTHLMCLGMTTYLSAPWPAADSVLTLQCVNQGDFCCFSVENKGTDTLYVNAFRWAETEAQTPVFELCWLLGDHEKSVMRIAPGQTILLDEFLYDNAHLDDLGNIIVLGALQPFDAQELQRQLQGTQHEDVPLSEEDKQGMYFSVLNFSR